MLRQSENLGFAKAVNVGLRQTAAQYYLVLNPDTRIGSTTLADSVAFLESHPDVGVMGAAHRDDEGHLAASNSYYPTAARLFYTRIGLRKTYAAGLIQTMNMDQQDLTQEAEVDQVMGAYMFIRGSVINEKHILLDEDYFVYYEDVQFCRDVIAADYKVVYNPAVEIYHYGQGTTRNIKAASLLSTVCHVVL